MNFKISYIYNANIKLYVYLIAGANVRGWNGEQTSQCCAYHGQGQKFYEFIIVNCTITFYCPDLGNAQNFKDPEALVE